MPLTLPINVTPVGNIGVLMAAPVNVSSGYTWGYNAESKALGPYTPNVQSVAYAGGLLDLLQAARLSDLNSARAAYENLRVFTENLAKQHNQLCRDLINAGIIAA